MSAVSPVKNWGWLYAVSAYTVWGILPLYWKLLEVVPALEILAHRIAWSFVFTVIVLLLIRGRTVLTVLTAAKRYLVPTLLCGVLISFNWYTYIWAVNSGFVIEASMGYYICPLVVVLLGVVVLREQLTRWQILATGLASIGVLILALQYGRIPWVALVLAGTFATYGLAKKLIPVDSVTGLALETSSVTPAAVIFIAAQELQGTGALTGLSLGTGVTLAGAGVVTAVPLLLFAQGARRVKLSTIGFFQYIAPSITLMLGIFVFREPFSVIHLVSFAFIWLGLLVFTLANLGVLKTLDAVQAQAKF